ncbi:MAG: hypothetical protein IJ087_02680 [Eggerthellaceae bacterium]|nr:hypothetical protein [Eggerthellaceae bacterium]
MLETIELRKPVMIDGEAVRELTCDTDLITSDQFIDAEILAANAAMRLRKMSTKVVELDAGFHYYLGVMAILAVNPGYVVEDVERIKGPDVLKVMKVGRNFMIAGAEEDEDEDSAPIEDWEDEEPEGEEPGDLPILG